MAIEIRDIADGLWIWRVEHPNWKPAFDWPPAVTSVYLESGGERILIDPLAPPGDAAAELRARLDARPPTMIVVIKPDHVRSVDLYVRRYGARAYGPRLFWRNDIPDTELLPIEPGSQLPGGLTALYDGRGRAETPLWVPELKTIVFGDAVTERDGELRVWWTPHLERAMPALRAMLDLPFERLILSHGEPVHDRAAFERALTLPAWKRQA